MRRLLLFKHWHLFILVFVFGAFVSPGNEHVVLNLIGIITFFSWIYVVSVYGHEKIIAYELSPLNIKFFKLNFFIFTTTACLSLFLTGILIPKTNDSIHLTDIPAIALSIYLVFAMFHILIFTAKTVSILIDHQKGGDYFGKFLLIFFFPIGVWFIQPKLNRIFTEDSI